MLVQEPRGLFLESGGMDIIHGGSNFFSLDSCFMFPDVSCVCIIFKIKVSNNLESDKMKLSVNKAKLTGL